jgi:hypothetical protein
MNDAELDELLNVWKAPAPREHFTRDLRAAIGATAERQPRKVFIGWKLGAAAAVVILAMLLANSNVFSQRSRPRFTVDSKIIRYDGWGGPPWRFATGPESPLITSYNQDGSEVILSWSSPDHPLQATLWKARMALSDTVDGMKDRVVSIAERLDPRKISPNNEDDDAFAVVYPASVGYPRIVGRRDSLLSSGCRTSFGGTEFLGQDVVLNYSTTVLRQAGGGHSMITLWMAPELSCFALRITIQAQQPDGSWKLVSERQALKVTMNR